MGYTAKSQAKVSRFSIKTIWGTARCPELKLSDGELHELVARETRKDSIATLSPQEIDKVCYALFQLKDSAKGKKRTDTGGSSATVKMRRKIYMLTGELGWNDDVSRINGLCKRVCKVDRLEWLSIAQCSMIMEALKDMIERRDDKTSAGQKAGE